MKANRNIKSLQMGINVILFIHLITAIIFFWGFRSSWNMIEVTDEDLKGVMELHKATRFSGAVKRSFEYVYDYHDTSNREKLLYTTNIAHLEGSYNSNTSIYNAVSHTSSGSHVDVPQNKLQLIIPVSHPQMRNLIYLIIGISVVLLLYSFMIFYQLKRFIRNVFSMESFTKENLRILYSIGIMVIIVPVLKYIAEYLELKWIENQYIFSNYSLHSDISFQFYFIGLGILILAITKVIKEGMNMKKEIELTV